MAHNGGSCFTNDGPVPVPIGPEGSDSWTAPLKMVSCKQKWCNTSVGTGEESEECLPAILLAQIHVLTATTGQRSMHPYASQVNLEGHMPSNPRAPSSQATFQGINNSH